MATSVAGPGFPREGRGCVNPRGGANLLFGIISTEKLHKNENMCDQILSSQIERVKIPEKYCSEMMLTLDRNN